MASGKSIVVSGDLGSGKSTVSREIARRLGLRRVSVGDLYREMAHSRGMSALQLNLHAELDDAVDGYVDQLQQEIAKSDEQLVVDGRLAWFFFTDAFKVHLVTDPAVAARRVLSRPSDEVEAYSSLAEAQDRLKNRSESERIRFVTRYGADKNRLRNYDLVCDTTSAPSGEVVEHIIAAYSEPEDDRFMPPPLLLLDPRRIYPTRDISAVAGPHAPADQLPATDPPASAEELPATGPLPVAYTGRCFYLLADHRRLAAAITAKLHLVEATLLAEGAERLAGGLTALQYFEANASPGVISRWEAANAVMLPPVTSLYLDQPRPRG
jgi:cytidylate kinase